MIAISCCTAPALGVYTMAADALPLTAVRAGQHVACDAWLYAALRLICAIRRTAVPHGWTTAPGAGLLLCCDSDSLRGSPLRLRGGSLLLHLPWIVHWVPIGIYEVHLRQQMHSRIPGRHESIVCRPIYADAAMRLMNGSKFAAWSLCQMSPTLACNMSSGVQGWSSRGTGRPLTQTLLM